MMILNRRCKTARDKAIMQKKKMAYYKSQESFHKMIEEQNKPLAENNGGRK